LVWLDERELGERCALDYVERMPGFDYRFFGYYYDCDDWFQHGCADFHQLRYPRRCRDGFWIQRERECDWI
jgi:hypothetical protein